MQQLNSTPRIIAIASLLLIASTACSMRDQVTPDTPSVTLANPQPGQTLPVGEPISVQSTSTDGDGIQRVELWVDNVLVRVNANPDKNSPYTAIQSWQSDTAGPHVIVVKAFDTEGTEGQSPPIAITLGEEAQAQALPAPTETPQPSPTPSPTQTPPPAAGTPTETPMVVCTPPPCEDDEITYCPDECPGGCGTQCATPTPSPTLSPTPPAFEPTEFEVHEDFESVWEQADVKDYLGYPTGEAVDERRYARQYFERGYFYWWERPEEPGLIWVVEMPSSNANWGHRWSGPYEDTWDGENPISCKEAESNPNGPIRGFGKVWCDHPKIARAVGAPREPERGTGNTSAYGVVQSFQGGTMLYSPLDMEVWVLFEGGTWQRHSR